LLARYEKAGGRFMVCPVCFNLKHLDNSGLLPNAELAGSLGLWVAMTAPFGSTRTALSGSTL
jgi:hypothetical protein